MIIRKFVSFILPLLLCSLCHAMYNLDGSPGEGYYMQVLIGQPPQSFNVLIDTGSTNFAVAAAPAPGITTYFNSTLSHSYVSLMREVSVLYTQGSWKGELGNDVIKFPSLDMHPLRCDICSIKTSQDFFLNGSQWQGILGLAYPAIARPDTDVLSWLESMSKANDTSLGFSLELCGPQPDNSTHKGNFRLLHRSPQPEFTSPIIREWFYELLLTCIEVGNKTVNLPCQELNTQKTIIDSGTTNLRLPEKVFASVLDLLTSQVPLHLSDDFWKHQSPFCSDEDLDLTLFPFVKLCLLQSKLSYFKLELSPESYLRQVYQLDPESSAKYCYKLAIEPSDIGSVLGAVVMEGFLVSFNRKKQTVGFNASDCGPEVKLRGPFASNKSLWDCRYEPSSPNALAIAGYVVSGMLCILAATFLYCTYGGWRRIRPAGSPTNALSLISK